VVLKGDDSEFRKVEIVEVSVLRYVERYSIVLKGVERCRNMVREA
jgi:hypothetical protein